MNDVSYLLDNSILPSIFTRAISVFPEFAFKPTSTGFISTNKLKITGETGNKSGGVYYYSNNQSHLIDYTRGSVSVWDYIAKRDDLNTNKQVLERLAELAGVSLPELNEETRAKIEARKKRATIYEAMQFYLSSSLGTSKEGSEIYKYIKERDLEGVEDLGYLPSIIELEDFLKETYSEDEYKDLLKLHKSIGDTHKLSIAYRDQSGSIVGYIFRQLQKEEIQGVGKYLYSTGLEISKNVFNLHNYKRGEGIILVEGIIDALTCQKRGVNNVVAIGSNNLGRDQANRLLELKPKDITLALDNDQAGEDGTVRAIDVLLEINPYVKIYVIKLPEGTKDVDQFIREKGAKEFQERSKKPYYLYLAERLVKEHNLSADKERKTTPEDIIDFKEEAFNIALKIKDATEIDIFTKGITKWTGGIITENSFKEERERRLEEWSREDQKRKLDRLLSKVGTLTREGDTKKAIETLTSDINEVKQEATRDAYTSLLGITSEKAIKESILSAPESLDSGYTLDYGGMTTKLTIPSGAITTIGARTSHGKTALLMNLAINFIKQLNGKTVHYFSYEESQETILLKLMNIFINKQFRTGKNNLDYIKGYYKSGGETYKNEDFLKGKDRFFKDLIESGKLKIHFSPYEVSELVEAIQFVKDQDNAGAILIDYLQRIPVKGTYATRQLEIQALSGRLVEVSVNTGLPVITASQFSRAVEDKGDLNLTKLREAGDIEQDANLVLGLWNNKFTKDETKTGLYLEVLKNRDGITGMSRDLEFNENTGKILTPTGYDNSDIVEDTFKDT